MKFIRFKDAISNNDIMVNVSHIVIITENTDNSSIIHVGEEAYVIKLSMDEVEKIVSSGC